MFSESAELYDLIYSGFKNYAAEAETLAAILQRVHPGGRTILDVACGTGEHARHLADRYGYQVDGVDLNPAFVRIAQAKLLSGSVHVGDMVSFDLQRQYDIVQCLFSSIGYVRTLENLASTLVCFRRHLAPHGVVIVEPWFPPGVLDVKRVHTSVAESDGLSVCRMSRIEVEGRLSRLHFDYLIGRPDGIRRASEVHELGLFTVEETMACFRRAGFDPEHDTRGLCDRGLYIAR